MSFPKHYLLLLSTTATRKIEDFAVKSIFEDAPVRERMLQTSIERRKIESAGAGIHGKTGGVMRLNRVNLKSLSLFFYPTTQLKAVIDIVLHRKSVNFQLRYKTDFAEIIAEREGWHEVFQVFK